MVTQFKGVQYRPSAPRNNHQSSVSGASQSATQPTNDQPNIAYGRVKEVIGGKRVIITYFNDNNNKDEDMKIPVAINSPGLEAIKTLYGGLKPGLPVRIFFKGMWPPDPLVNDVKVDVIGGFDDDIAKDDADPEPEELATGPYKLFSGGLLP